MDKQPTETKEGGEMMESNWNETVENFEDLNIKEELLRGIYGNFINKNNIKNNIKNKINNNIKKALIIIQNNNIIIRFWFRKAFSHLKKRNPAPPKRQRHHRPGIIRHRKDSNILNCCTRPCRHFQPQHLGPNPCPY